MQVNLSEMYIDDEIKKAVNAVLDSGQYVKGKNLTAFEAEFAAYCNSEYAIGVNSGTSAMLLTMMALGVGRGDEIIVPSHTFIATASPAKFLGATPVYVDIDPVNYNIDPEKLEEAITPNTKAIIPVHLYGHPADMDPIMRIAKKHGVYVVEDACQAHGAEYRGKKAGSIGNFAVFSFFPSKNMTVAGDGGMVITDDKEMAHKMSMLRDHGRTDKYLHELLGLNLRMSEIPAAIGRQQLKHLPQWVERRRQIASMYNDLLEDAVTVPQEADWAKHAYYVYTLQTSNRDALREYLQTKGISTGVYYPVPVHRQPCMEAHNVELPVTDECVQRILSIPMHPKLTDEQIHYIADNIKRGLK